MFQTGSQINPALGRVDYSAYTQGAVAGGQSIGQGIANLGQSIAGGIEQYIKKKEAKKELDDAIVGVTKLAESNPDMAAKLGITADILKDPQAIKSVVKSVGGPAATNSMILQFAQQQQQYDQSEAQRNKEFNRTKEAESRTAQAGLAFSGSGMESLTPQERVSILASQGFTPAEIAAAQTYDLNLQARRAEIDKIKAEKTVNPTEFNIAYNAFKQANPNATPEKIQDFVTNFKLSGKPTTTTNIINTPENKGEIAAEEVIGKSIGEQYNAIGSAADISEKSALTLDRVKSLYDQGAYTGAGVGLVSGLGKFAATIGLNVPEQASQDQLEQVLQEGALARTRELFKGTGSLSNLEGSKGEQTVANLSRTPVGNIKILEWQSRNAPVLRAADDLKISLREKGMKPEKIVSEVRKYVKDNYIKLNDVTSSEKSIKPAVNGEIKDIYGNDLRDKYGIPQVR
jgi:hypothetical protein